MKLDKIKIVFASVGLIAAAALAGVAYSMDHKAPVKAATTSTTDVTCSTSTVVAGKTFSLKVTGSSKYTDKYWRSQTIQVYSDSYSKLTFSSSKVDDLSGKAEEVLGNDIYNATYYKVGINVEDTTGRPTSKPVTFTVTFKLDASVAEGTKLNFYLKTDAVFQYYPEGTANESKLQVTPQKTQSAPLTLTVKKETTSKITYNLNGGTNPSSAPTTYVEGTGATLPTPTRSGYTFGGWFTTSACTGTAVTKVSTTDTGDKTFYAKWTEIPASATKSKITYNLNGGTNPSGAPTEYAEGVGCALPTPTKSGYTFGGWFTSSDFSGSAVSSISASDKGAKTFYAKWTEVKGDDPEPVVTSEVTLTIGVNDPAMGTVDQTSITVPVGSKIKTSKNVLTIIGPDGTEIASITATPVEADPNAEASEDGAKPKSYQFKSWEMDSKTVNEDMTITANFKEKGNFNWLYVICGCIVLTDFLIFFIPYKKNFNQPKGGN